MSQQFDRVFINGGEYVRWDEAVRTVMALQTELYDADARANVLSTALAEIVNIAPSLPKVHQWTGQDAAEELFDMGLRHKSGQKPYDYLKTWLNMLRPFAYATQDDSWGEMEKLLCIVMRNYVRVAAAAERGRSALPPPTPAEA